ncbi:hypothetical protein NDU88_003681 [Pleurodeles waltl]|uniref:Uncharacterized protein n=1 Tax=Pleurodeles waltl TaxID=8319 RepID=A0AAV7NLD5_PLEWA|nr:hypothetical protein NDU88_003681 [Pleurodeles waltl]
MRSVKRFSSRQQRVHCTAGRPLAPAQPTALPQAARQDPLALLRVRTPKDAGSQLLHASPASSLLLKNPPAVAQVPGRGPRGQSLSSSPRITARVVVGAAVLLPREHHHGHGAPLQAAAVASQRVRSFQRSPEAARRCRLCSTEPPCRLHCNFTRGPGPHTTSADPLALPRVRAPKDTGVQLPHVSPASSSLLKNRSAVARVSGRAPRGRGTPRFPHRQGTLPKGVVAASQRVRSSQRAREAGRR